MLELTKQLQPLKSKIEVLEEEISSIKQSIMNQIQEVEMRTYQEEYWPPGERQTVF